MQDAVGSRRIPTAAWLFAAIQLVTVIWVSMPGGAWWPNSQAATFGTILFLLLGYGVVRGNNIAWSVALIIEIITVPFFVIAVPWPWDSTVWISFVLGALSLTALLSRDVRHHVGASGDALPDPYRES